MYLHKSINISAIIFVILMGISCSRTTMAPPGTEVIISKRPEKAPKWIDNEPGIKSGYFYFVGLVDRATREDLARADAKANARIELARDLASRIISRYGFGRDSQEGRYVEEAASMISDAVVRGAHSSEWYTIQYALTPSPGEDVSYYYKVYVLMKTTEESYRNSLLGAVRDKIDENDKSPTGKAILKKLEKDLEEGNWIYKSN